MSNPSAYVSSSYEDLVEYRRKAVDVLRRHRCQEHGMESYAAGPDLVSLCLDDVRSCQLFVLILGWRYGTVLPEYDRSLTELEYEAAREAGLHIAAFVVSEEAHWPLRFTDLRTREGEGGARIDRFRQRLIDDRLRVSYFDDPDGFERELSQAVVHFLAAYSAPPPPPGQREPAPVLASDLGAREHLEGVVRSMADFRRLHVPLSAVTWARPQEPEPWLEVLDHESFQRAAPRRAAAPAQAFTLGDVREALALHRQFLLVGGPGAGKSTTLQHLLLEQAHLRLEDPGAPFPLLVNIGGWSPEERSFGDMVADEIRDQTGLPLSPDRLLLLIDGYVEPSGDEEDATLASIGTWLERRSCAAVLAVREQSVAIDLPVVRLNPLDDGRVASLATARLGPDRGRSLLDWLGQGGSGGSSGAGSAEVDHLVRNPFNLSLMCYLAVRGSAPATRGELVRRFVQAAHDRELRAQWIPELEYEEFVRLMGRLAMDSVRMRKPPVMDEAWAQRRLPGTVAASALLRFARDCRALRVSTAQEGFEFEHRLMLEYFAAEYLSRYPGALENVLSPPRYADAERVAERMDDVLRTLCQLDGAAPRFEVIANSDPCLAASCLAGMDPAEPGLEPLRERVVRGLVAVLESADDSARAAATTALVSMGAGCVEPLRQAMRTAPHWVRRYAILVFSQIPAPGAVEALVEALGDSYRWVRHDAERALMGLERDGVALLRRYVAARIPVWKTGAEREAAERLLPACAALDAALADEIRAAAGLPLAPAPVEEAPEPLEVAEPEPSRVEALQPEHDIVAWGRRILDAWRRDPGNPEFTAEGQRWLRFASSFVPLWSQVWAALWYSGAQAEQMDRLGRRWLAEEPEASGWGTVWQALWERRPHDPGLRKAGREWLAAHQRAPTWPTVWRNLWDAAPGDAELARVGREWLGVAPGSEDWGVVWSALWKWDPSDAELPGIGRFWLTQAAPTHESWPFIWTDLLKRHPTDPELVSHGRRWLAAVPVSHPAWGDVWVDLWHSHPRDAELETYGRHWLLTASPSHSAWHWIWQELWTERTRDAELTAHARRWLDTAAPTHPGWWRIWLGMWTATPGDPELVEHARRWLPQVPPGQLGWGFIWSRLFAGPDPSPDLLPLGRHWLQRAAPATPGWYAVWRALWDAGDARPALEASGRAWLAGPGAGDAGFGYVLAALWYEHPRDAELDRMAREWLRTTRSNGWYHVWNALWNEQFGDGGLVTIAIGWLGMNEQDERTWLNVWKALLPVAGTNETFIAAGLHLLRSRTATPSTWRYVAGTLDALGRLPDDVRSLGEHAGEQGMQVAKKISAAMAFNDSWARRWVDAWEGGLGRPALADSGLRWLAGPTRSLRPWPFLWRSLYEGSDPVPAGMVDWGREWLGTAPGTVHGWALVWEVIVKRYPEDEPLRAAGWLWMDRSAFGRTSWTRVFEALWELESGRRGELARIGSDWLERNVPGRKHAGRMWCLAWSETPGDPELERWGQALLAIPNSSDGWPEVPLQLHAVPALRDQVRPLLERWLAEHPSHALAGEVGRELSNEPAMA